MKHTVYLKVLFFSAAAIITVSTAFSFLTAQGTGPAQPKGQAVVLSKTIHDCWSFSDMMIHPLRYVLTSLKSYQSPPLIYDIYSDTLIPFPEITKIPGMPAAGVIPVGGDPKERALKKSELILKGEYWQWHDKQLVYYNPGAGKAGIVLEKSEVKKTVAGIPPCAKCGAPAKLVTQYYRYYCYACKEYVKESDYTKEFRAHYYADMDLAQGKITAFHELKHDGFRPGEQEGVDPLGVDESGTHFYYSNRVYFYKSEKSTGHILLYRLDIPTGKVDLTCEAEIPVRYKGKAPVTYSVHSYPSPDFKNVLFWEYDEASDTGSNQGSLNNPEAQAVIIDTQAKTHFSVKAPFTAYGQLFDRDGRYCVLGSNQTGYLHRIDMKLKKEDLKVKGSKSIYKLILSSGSKYLYVFNKYSIEVRSWPGLGLSKTIPLQSVFPGIKSLLVSESVLATADGKYAVIGILKKSEHGPWWASDKQDGFYILSLGD